MCWWKHSIKGNPAPLANDVLQIEVTGEGHLAGAGNGNPQSFEAFQNDTVNLFYGKAVIILGSDFEKGTLKLRVKSANLGTETISIKAE